MNFLVSGCNGDIGVSILNLLLEEFPEANIYASDCKKPKKIFDKIKYLKFPHCSADSYFNHLKKIIFEKKIDLFIPTIDQEITILSKKNLKDIYDKILINENNIIRTFSDKLETALWFKKNKFPSLRTFDLKNSNSNDLPLVIKPRFGSGSKEIFFCTNPLFHDALKTTLTDQYIAQEMLDKDLTEYTIALIKLNNVSQYCIMERELFGGISIKIKIVKNNKIRVFLKKFSSLMPNFCFLNLQIKIYAKNIYCFEINPRFSSTVLMRKRIGFNDFLQTVKYKLNKNYNLDFTVNSNITVHRRFDKFIIE